MGWDAGEFFGDLVDKGEEIVSNLVKDGGKKGKDLVKKGMELFTGIFNLGGNSGGGKPGTTGSPPGSGSPPPTPPKSFGGGITSWVKENPLQSLGIGALAAFLLWMAFGRKSKSSRR